MCTLSVIVRKKENRNWTKSDSAGGTSYFERNPESDAVICGCSENVLRCGEWMLHEKHISNLFGFVLFCFGVAQQASGGPGSTCSWWICSALLEAALFVCL